MPNLCLQMLLRGRNTVGYTPYPTEVTTEGAFVVGALVSGERQRRHELREAWPARWEKASAADRWSWLG